MRASKYFSRTRIVSAVALAAVGLISSIASADTVEASYNSATDVPVTANGYTATGNTVNFTLNFAPDTGTDLMVLQNTALGFINGTFDNLAQGQAVSLSYGGVNYRFVANYYGGSGNDLMLVWASKRVFAWAGNQFGEVGDNTTALHRAPVAVETTGVLAGKTVVALAAGGYHTLALCSDGTLAAWGYNYYGQVGDNQASGWESLVPVAVNVGPGSALYGKTVVGVAAGFYHSVAVCSDGTVAAWGWNNIGQLGDNSTTTRFLPVAVDVSLGVSALYGKSVVAVAAGNNHNLALCSDGTVVGWGSNGSGQLGDNLVSGPVSGVPVSVNTNSSISALYGKTPVAVAAGQVHSLALCSDGTVLAWGNNASGRLGDNTLTQRNVPVAVNTDSGVSALYGKMVVAIAVGASYNLALCSDGTVAGWGYNYDGELGDNTATDRRVPVAVNTSSGISALYGKRVVTIAAGAGTSLASCADGTAVGWGNNGYGGVGDNTTTLYRRVPVMVSTSQLATNQRFNCVVSGSQAIHELALVAGPPASDITLGSPQILTNLAFQFAFTNTPGAFFGVVAATNPGQPLSTWTSLTGLTGLSPGRFLFTDSQATNSPQRYYRIRSP